MKPMAAITTVKALEKVMGAAPLGVRMKIIDHLDAEAVRVIAASTIAFVAVDAGPDGGEERGLRVTLAGGPAGTFSVLEAQRVVLPRASLDDLEPFVVGRGAGMLWLVPGLGETLRVNGRVAAVDDAGVQLAVDEVYLHCAKALLRSGFWKATPRDAVDDVVAHCSFLALATVDAAGHVDVSPRGDPPGALLRRDGPQVAFADRPGNRLADSLHNLLARPAVALVALVPGSTTVAVLRGRGQLTHDDAARAAFTVDGKVPALVTRIDVEASTTRASTALARAAPWPVVAQPQHGIDPAAVLVAHVKRNKARGLGAMAIRAAVSKTLVGKGLDSDYRNRLY